MAAHGLAAAPGPHPDQRSGFGTLGANISIAGTTAHGYLVIVVITALLIAGYLLLRSGWSTFPVRLPIAHETLLLAGTGV